MKKVLFFVFVLTVTMEVVSAQTVRPWVVENADSCYLYTVDTLPPTAYSLRIYNAIPLWAFGEFFLGPNMQGEVDMTSRYSARGVSAVYGIAVTAPEPLLGNMHLDLSVLDSDSRVVRLASASNGDPYIKTNYKYETIVPSLGYEYGHWECSSYEYYFDRPIHIAADSFYAGIRVVTSQAPYDEYMWYQIFCLEFPQTFYYLSKASEIGSIRTAVLSTLGNFFPIVKLPCQTPVRPVLMANVPGLAKFYLGDGDHEALQVAIYDDAGDTVLLSDTTSNPQFVFSAAAAARWYEVRVRSVCTYCFSGVDTLAFSHWSEPLRFYYTPDTTAIDPAAPQPPTSDFLPTIHPNPTTGLLNVELGNWDFEGTAATLQILDLEGRLLQEFQIPNSKFQIDLSSYPAGTYLLRAAGATRRVVKK